MPHRILVCWLALCGLAQAGDPASRIESGLRPRYRVGEGVTWNIAARMTHHRTPGVGLAVVRSGRIVLAKGYGVTEAGGRAVDSQTLFQAASISKPVAALAALRMVQDGALSLDQDVNARLKTWKVPENELTSREKVTLRRLLSHSAGLTVHGFPGYNRSAGLPTVAQILDGVKPGNTPAVRVDIEPGSRWRYSGGGYTVLQQLLVDASGKPFPELLRALVLGPIGMSRSTFEQPLPARLAGNASRAHNGEGRKIDGDFHVYPEMAAAGLWTTPSDLARFGIELWKASRGESRRVISSRTAKEMLAVQKGEYGLGVGVTLQDGLESFGHGGANAGYRCRWIMLSRSGNGAVVMTSGDRGGPLIDEILRAVAAAEDWPVFRPENKTVVRVSPDILAEYAGTYQLGAARVKFEVSGEGLLATLPSGRTTEFLPESPTRFFSQEAPPALFRAVAGGFELEIGGDRARRQRP